MRVKKETKDKGSYVESEIRDDLEKVSEYTLNIFHIQ